jgi:hypothetical protein
VTLEWSNEGAGSYNVYYDQAGKSVLIAQGLTGTTFTDTGLTNGSQYCYKVTSVGACESAFSNVLCATPTNQGQATMKAGVTSLATGVLSGKGGAKIFTPQTTFKAGSAVTFKATVVDQGGLPLSAATVDILITGPESLLVTSATSDANGIAYATWSTKAPGKRTAGTTTGTYTGTTKGVTATGYSWDGVETNTTFVIQ